MERHTSNVCSGRSGARESAGKPLFYTDGKGLSRAQRSAQAAASVWYPSLAVMPSPWPRRRRQVTTDRRVSFQRLCGCAVADSGDGDGDGDGDAEGLRAATATVTPSWKPRLIQGMAPPLFRPFHSVLLSHRTTRFIISYVKCMNPGIVSPTLPLHTHNVGITPLPHRSYPGVNTTSLLFFPDVPLDFCYAPSLSLFIVSLPLQR